MKRHGNLFHKIVDLDNLYDAFDKAKKGKQHYEGVQKFAAALPYSITNIQTALKDRTFTTSKYMERFLYVPKLRTIYVLPFKDRVVQHALMNITSPIFLNGFVHNTYSCIKGRGVHAGCLKAKEYLHKFRYCLQCDISKFYPSINHEILKEVFRTRIKCKDTLWLMDNIVDSMPGEINVPIGNLTSQWFGNAYMTELDHLIMFEWKTPNYVRYCDDFVMFSNDKGHLRELQAKITEYLAQKRQLKLSKSILFPVSQGLDFLGYRFFRGYTLLRKRTAKHTRRRLLRKTEQFKNGEITFDYYRAILASAKGWMQHANTHNFRRSIDFEGMYGLLNQKEQEMRGVSKILATEQDIINNMSVDKAATKKLLIELRDTRFCWMAVGELADGDPGVTDEVHMVQLEPINGADMMDPNAPTRRVQYEFKEDPNAHIFKIGLTVSKVNQYINACE